MHKQKHPNDDGPLLTAVRQAGKLADTDLGFEPQQQPLQLVRQGQKRAEDRDC